MENSMKTHSKNLHRRFLAAFSAKGGHLMFTHSTSYNTISRYVALVAMMSGLLLANPSQSAATTDAASEAAQHQLYQIAFVLHNAVDLGRTQHASPVSVSPETFTAAESAIRNVQQTAVVAPQGKMARLALDDAVTYLRNAKKQWRRGDTRLAMDHMTTAIDFIDTAAQYYHLQMR